MKARRLLSFSFFSQAHRLRTPDLSVFALPLPSTMKKHVVLVSVSKKRVSLSTQRNRVKRQIREKVRLEVNSSTILTAPLLIFIRVNSSGLTAKSIEEQGLLLVKKLEERQSKNE